VGRAWVAATATLCVFLPRPADARPSARLVYSRAAGAESCPDERALRAAVAQRVGYDPFFSWVKPAVVASMSPAGKRGFVVRILLVDEQGVESGMRELHVDGECADLLDPAALAIAIAIDPQSLAPRRVEEKPAPYQPPPPSAAPAARPNEEAPSPEPAPAPTGSPVTFEGIAGAVASAGVAPEPALGARLGASARWRNVSVDLEGRVDAPASRGAQGGGVVSSWLAVATLAPCIHAGRLFACGLVQMGRMRASGPGSDQWAAWWGAGGRLGVLVPLSARVDFRLASDLVGDFAYPTLDINGVPVWKAPPLSESLGADVVVQF
jgi:hypothetical protein